MQLRFFNYIGFLDNFECYLRIKRVKRDLHEKKNSNVNNITTVSKKKVSYKNTVHETY